MGLFDWRIKPKSNVRILDDQIWLTGDAKFGGIAAQGAELLGAHDDRFFLIMTAHFRDCLQSLEKSVEQCLSRNPRVLVCLAGSLEEDLKRNLRLEASRIGMLLVAERHLLRSHDETIETPAGRQPCPCHVTYNLSLEDPVLRLSGCNRIDPALKQMGMGQSESISARFVSRAVRSA